MGKVGGDKNPKRRDFNVLLQIRGDRLTVFDNNGLMLVVYYCVVDISNYIVLSRCKVCSIVIFSGVKLLA